MELPSPESEPVSQDVGQLSDQHMYELLKDAEHRLEFALKDPSMASTAQKPSSILSTGNSLYSDLDNTQTSSYIITTSQGTQIDPVVIILNEQKVVNGSRIVTDSVHLKSTSPKAKIVTAGADWYDLPRTILTPELKRDMQLLQLRSVLDPKRHFKKEIGKPHIPEFFQVGTIIEGATEFFSARMTKKERKRTFVEDVLAGEITTQRFRSKYNQIQSGKTSGKRAHYMKLKAKRK